jgi:hypothetical protein
MAPEICCEVRSAQLFAAEGNENTSNKLKSRFD